MYFSTFYFHCWICLHINEIGYVEVHHLHDSISLLYCCFLYPNSAFTSNYYGNQDSRKKGIITDISLTLLLFFILIPTHLLQGLLRYYFLMFVCCMFLYNRPIIHRIRIQKNCNNSGSSICCSTIILSTSVVY